MKTTIDWKRTVWVAEVVLIALATLMLLPTVLLYVLDLAAGIIAPDAGWGFGTALGLTGIWIALLGPGFLNQSKSRIRWVVIVALGLAVVCLARPAWGFGRTEGANVPSALLIMASTAIALHQLVTLLRRGKASALDRAA